MDLVSSAPVTLWADFEASQGLLIPEAGSVYYSLYDATGAVLVLKGDLTPEAEATGVSISIDAVHNLLAPNRSFERRLLTLHWIAQGRSYSRRLNYRIVEMPLHSVVPDQVREYLSLGEDELPNEAIDLFSAQIQLEELVGKETFASAITSGTMLELRAERALILTAASALFPSLRYRIAQSKSDGTAKFERLKDPAAFGELVAATAGELASNLIALLGPNAPTSTVTPFLLQLSTITTDPITGSAPVAAGA